MALSPLHGLNVVHHDDSYRLDQRDLLSTPQIQADLAAQLDVWTNLSFQSDEPLSKEDGGKDSSATNSPTIDDDKDEEQDPEGPANPESHANVVNAIAISQPGQHLRLQHQRNNLDVNTVLANFGIDPFLVPPVPAPQQPHSASLAQLLSSYPFAHDLQHHQHNVFSELAPPTPQQQSAEPETGGSVPGRRVRARKAPLDTPMSASTPPASSSSLPPNSPVLMPKGMAEDKRKRNTAASARFRAKKKEREVALERRSKDLEGRVSELERECEQLRRENGWLMGLVVGVTGANGGPGGAVVPGLPPSSATGKRKRDDDKA